MAGLSDQRSIFGGETGFPTSQSQPLYAPVKRMGFHETIDSPEYQTAQMLPVVGSALAIPSGVSHLARGQYGAAALDAGQAIPAASTVVGATKMLQGLRRWMAMAQGSDAATAW